MNYVDSLMGQNERILYLTRQHWIVLLRDIVVYGLIALVIGIAGGLAGTLGVVVIPGLGGLGFLLLLLEIVPLLLFLRAVVIWYNEQYLITNWRVIQVEGVVNKHVIDSSLEKVNDVVLNQSVLGRMLNYGNVEILTGSEIGVNLLEKIHGPVQFKTAMLNAKEALSQVGAFDERTRVVTAKAPTAGDVPELIAELDELRQKGLITQEEFEVKKKDLLTRI